MALPAAADGKTTLSADEQPRLDTTLAKLAALQPILGMARPSRPVTRQASMTGLCLAAGFRGSIAAVGSRPASTRARHGCGWRRAARHGIGPVEATGRLLARLQLRLADFDVIEINEAFAAQVLAVTRALGSRTTRACEPQWRGNRARASARRKRRAARAHAMRELECSGGRRALVTLCVASARASHLRWKAPDLSRDRTAPTAGNCRADSAQIGTRRGAILSRLGPQEIEHHERRQPERRRVDKEHG